MSGKNLAIGTAISVDAIEPYNFVLTLRIIRLFEPTTLREQDRMRLASRISGIPTLVEVSQISGQMGKIEACSAPASDAAILRSIVEWVIFSDLDLKPFYTLAAENQELAWIARSLRGLKPIRPVSLFEMAVVAVTEQQISLAAAHSIRSRIIQRFGVPIGEERVFPEPRALATASTEELRSCGLSNRKTQYIHELAQKVSDGFLDLDSLKSMSDDEAREAIMSLRGFGRWSADYILVRGLARPDCVPIDDLAVQSVVGKYLLGGHRASALEVEASLEPFRPYRGLAAFYLLAEHRLSQATS